MSKLKPLLHQFQMLLALLALVGLVLLWFYGVQVSTWIFCLFFRKNSLQKYKSKNKKSWAIVTGATAGIGLAFCEELISKGWNIFMISRSIEKLEIIKSNLLSQVDSKVEIEIFDWEASQVEEETENFKFSNKISELEAKLGDKDVGLLVNNVGTTENTFGWFSDTGTTCDNRPLSEEEHVNNLIDTIKINCVFPSKLTAAILPRLRSRENKFSGIINISSILAHLPCPFNPIYGASKAYNRSFSRAITAEYGQLGIDVLCVSPGMVTSNLTGIKESTWFCAGARETAMYSLRALGCSVEIFPHPIHGLTFFFGNIINILPQKIGTVLTALTMRFLPKPPGINVSRSLRKY